MNANVSFSTIAPTIVGIRTITEKDAEAFARLVKDIDKENPFATREDGESMGPLDMIYLWLRETAKDPSQHVLLAEIGTAQVGYLIIKGGGYRRVAHACTFMLGVKERYQRQGVGQALLEAAEDWAKRQGMIRFELSVIDGNTAALNLYEKTGFREEGRKKKSFRLNGEYKDEIMLAKVMV